jgi:hypothetical protein
VPAVLRAMNSIEFSNQNPARHVSAVRRVLGSGWRAGQIYPIWRGQGLTDIRRIAIVFAGNADKCEQRIAAGAGQRGSYPMGSNRLADWTDRLVRRQPGGFFELATRPRLAPSAVLVAAPQKPCAVSPAAE